MRERVLDSRARAAVVRMAHREAAVLGLMPAHSDRVESPIPAVELIVRHCPQCGAGYAPATPPMAAAVIVPQSTGTGLPTVEMLGCEELNARALLMVAVQAATGVATRFVTRSVEWHALGHDPADGTRLVRLDRREGTGASGGANGGAKVLPVATRKAPAPQTAYIHAAQIVAAHTPSPTMDSANDLYHAARVRAVSRLLRSGPATDRAHQPSFGGGFCGIQ